MDLPPTFSEVLQEMKELKQLLKAPKITLIEDPVYIPQGQSAAVVKYKPKPIAKKTSTVSSMVVKRQMGEKLKSRKFPKRNPSQQRGTQEERRPYFNRLRHPEGEPCSRESNGSLRCSATIKDSAVTNEVFF